KVVTRERSVKAVGALRGAEQVLDFLVECPAESEAKLMRSLGPGQVVADLVVVGFVDPRPAGDFKVRSGAAVQVYVRDAVKVVGAAKQPGSGKSRIAGRQAGQACSRKRNDVDPVAVVVERDFVHQGRADGVGCVHYTAVRGVAKSVSN